MTHDRILGEVEADLAALRAAADRASQALTGLFAATGDRQGAPRGGSAFVTIVLTFAFLMM
jgi:hypothetical protein